VVVDAVVSPGWVLDVLVAAVVAVEVELSVELFVDEDSWWTVVVESSRAAAIVAGAEVCRRCSEARSADAMLAIIPTQVIPVSAPRMRRSHLAG
jgi:hypothetical protein